MSGDCKLVTGSETGHDAAVPVVHYFEGMMSLGPYRVPDAGRDMQQILDDVPEKVAKFQTGRVYRLPLWELVYHECVVAHWYWGDYNNKTAGGLDPPRPVQCALRHAADVHVQQHLLCGRTAIALSAVTAPLSRSPGPPVTRRWSPTAG